MSAKAALIFNPRAGRWRTERRVESLGEILGNSGFSVELRQTAKPGHATDLARLATADGCEAVFVFGGDGTIREAAAGLIGTGVALGPIPGGTVNVLVQALGLPLHPLRAAAAFANATTLEMDVGICGDESFLILTSAGLDAHIMGNLHSGLKRRVGKASVAWSGLQRWLSYDYPQIHVTADGRPHVATFAAICNLPYYAGKWKLAPEASITDRALDLVLFHGAGRLEALAFARDLALGRHVNRDDVEIIRAQEIEVLSPARIPMQIDGDAMPLELPVTLTIASQRLTLLTPATTAL
jgi:YegS/Rv2252/BmrU family lipid kinase